MVLISGRAVVQNILCIVENRTRKFSYHRNLRLNFCSTVTFGLFVLINLSGFRYLNNSVYKIDSIWKKYSKFYGSARIAFWNKLYCSLTYTGVIFFGVKFSFEKIQHKNVWAVGYFYLQYVLGLVCLAYLFNFVISN